MLTSCSIGYSVAGIAGDCYTVLLHSIFKEIKQTIEMIHSRVLDSKPVDSDSIQCGVVEHNDSVGVKYQSLHGQN